jgi:putative transposase
MNSNHSETKLLESSPNTVLIDDSNFNTDIHEFIRQLVQDGVEPSKYKFRLVSWVASSPDRATRRARKSEVVSYLNVGKRTLERWLQIHFAKGTAAIPENPRPRKGKHKLTQDWEQRIIDIWEEGNKFENEMSPMEVSKEVERIAEKLEMDKYPSYWTVLRILKPLIEEKETKAGVYSAGQGLETSVKTRGGKKLKASYPNRLVQIDHTLIDVFSVFEDEEEVLYVNKISKRDRTTPPKPGVIRLWLTVIKDLYSKCILSHLLGAKQPGSKEVGLAIKRAIRPKNFPPDYDLKDVGIPFGCVRIIHTDAGSDLDSEHVKEIGLALELIGPNLGFTHYLRQQTEDGGAIESVFNGLNKRVLSQLPGYTNSNVTRRVKGAEKRACLTHRTIDKILSWYFYGEYNHEAPKRMIRTRYEQWLYGLRGELPAVIDDRRLDICLMKVVKCNVYRHGKICFKNQQYKAEILKAYEGKTVTMRYDPDNILRVLVFEQETDEKPGRFLGVAVMQNVRDLNKRIVELKLDIRLINLKNLEAEIFSLDELEEINQAARASRSAANASTKGIRAKYRGKRRDLVEAEKTEAKKRARKESRDRQHKSLKAIAQNSTRPSEESVPSQPAKKSRRSGTKTSAVENQQNQLVSIDAEAQVPATNQPVSDPGTLKVIDFSKKKQQRRLQFFEERLKARNPDN